MKREFYTSRNNFYFLKDFCERYKKEFLSYLIFGVFEVDEFLNEGLSKCAQL